jgi:hypothetical protein
MATGTVFVVESYQNGELMYWQDHTDVVWSWLSDRWTKVWKTRRGAERFLEFNKGVGGKVVEVSENAPRSAWRHLKRK